MTLAPLSLSESARKKFLMNRRASCLESGNKTFLGSGGRNDSKTAAVRSNRLAKIFR